MTDQRELDQLLGAYFVDGSNELSDRVIDAALDQIDHTEQRRPSRVPWRFSTMSMPTRVATAAVIGLLAVGGTLYLDRPGQPAIAGPGPTAGASASPSQAAVVAPRATATASPSPTPKPILWTQASLKEDWPAPVRPEPAGGAIMVPLQEDGTGVIPDPLGDTGSAAHPWVDIRELRGGGARIIIELGALTPHVPPTEQWIAYGVVVDDDRDGIPDRRLGIDNVPSTAPGKGDHRAWMTDLHTGRTVVGIAAILGGVGETKFDTFYPSSIPGRTGAWLQFGGQSPGGGSSGLVVPFYAWASMIENGRVVATDYAPDVGWLLDPGSTPKVESSPSPGPTPQVEADPDVPGGRLWTVTVVNKSSQPATLFVAEDGTSGMGRLVGTVTPNVVPPNTTMKVILALPANGSSGWAIFVNPGRDTGPLVMWTEVPLAGEIQVGKDGKPGWLSP